MHNRIDFLLMKAFSMVKNFLVSYFRICGIKTYVPKIFTKRQFLNHCYTKDVLSNILGYTKNVKELSFPIFLVIPSSTTLWLAWTNFSIITNVCLQQVYNPVSWIEIFQGLI